MIWLALRMAKLFGGALHKHVKTPEGVMRYAQQLYPSKGLSHDMVGTLSLVQEYDLLTYLSDYTIAPRPLRQNDDTILLEYVTGKAVLIDAFVGNNELLNDVIGKMIFIHNIDIASNDVLKPNKQSLLELINTYENILQDNNMLYTSTKNAIAWLKSSPYIDTHMHTPVLLHGDYKMDNILIENNRVSRVLDWEFCHVGRPLEDLAWFLSPLWQGYNANINLHNMVVKSYEKQSGNSVDVDELRFWEVYSYLKFSSIASIQHEKSKRSYDINLHVTGWRMYNINNVLGNLVKVNYIDKNVLDNMGYVVPSKIHFIQCFFVSLFRCFCFSYRFSDLYKDSLAGLKLHFAYKNLVINKSQ